LVFEDGIGAKMEIGWVMRGENEMDERAPALK